MSSVTATIVADIEKQVGAGIARLKAKHDEELRSDIARLREDLESQLSRVAGLAARMAKPATVEAVKTPTVVATPKITPKRPVRKSKGLIRFRDPANPDKTWTGRGTQPNWFKAGLAAGKSRADFAVANA